MAFIDQSLPSGRDILSNPGRAGKYGEHALTVIEPDAVVLTALDGEALAGLTADGYSVDLAGLDAREGAARVLVPYVNAFLGGEGRVEKYWRTKRYRVAPVEGAPAVTAVASTVAPAQAPATFVAPTVVASPAAVMPTKVTDVAGVIVPKKQPVRALGRTKAEKGWSKVGDIVVRDEHLDRLNDAWALRQSGARATAIITGPAGTAKTALAYAFAASLGVPFLKVDGGAIRTADDWAGSVRQDASTKVWAHRWSPFAQVLKIGQPCVVLVDEITRTESPQALNAFTGLLDDTGSLSVPDAHDVLHLPAGVFIIATANIGPEFVGSLPLDGAVRQRFNKSIRMEYPPESIEAGLICDITGLDPEIAERLVTMAVTQRANRMDPSKFPSGGVISTRTLLDIARTITLNGRDPRSAVRATLDGQFDPEDEEHLSICVDTQFPAAPIEDDETLSEGSDEEHADAAWTCPACGSANAADMVVCWGPTCTYTRPSGGAGNPLIRLQNAATYGNP